MSREGIIAANPIVEFFRKRGYELRSAGENYVTNASPVTQHKRGHRPVMVYPKNNSWYDHDLKIGGSVIDWVMHERGCDAAQAIRELSSKNHAPEIVATYDYRDEGGNLLFQCVRFRPKQFRQRHPDGNGGWIWNLEGVRRVLYRFPDLLEGLKRGLPVIICEGEKDVDALRELGLSMAVTCNPMGAGKWRDEYSETLRGATVYVIADKDEPDEQGRLKGQEHAQQVAASLDGKAKRVVALELPDRNSHKVKDPSDWIAAGGNAGEMMDLLHAAREWKPRSKSTSATQIERLRIAKLTPPPHSLTSEDWRDVIKANFPALVRAAEICLCVEAQLLLNDVRNPFALALVDVPASGKTITLNFFDGLPELTYTTDNFTPASFVSHASNVKREELGSVDLLPRIRYRTLIVRELGSIFGAKDDDLIKSLGILTRVLDGEGLETDSGVHGRRGYKGDYLFMLLAGTPPIPPRVFKIMGNFGSRLFFLSLHTPDEDDDDLIAQNKGTAHKLKETECQQATKNLLRTLWAANPTGVEWNKADDPDDCLRVIARCARLLAALRGAINVWQSDHPDEVGMKLLHNIPVIEKPHRINCLLYNLARAHALVCERRKLASEDLWPVLEVTFDSAPTIRAKLFRGLIEAGGTLNTSDVVELLRCSAPTARKEMEALSILGIVDKTAEDQNEPGQPETRIALASTFAWFGSKGCKSLMGSVTDIEGGNLFKIQPGQGIKKEFPPCVTVKDGSAQDVDTSLPAEQSAGQEKLRL